MKKLLFIILNVVFLNLLLTNSSHAYLDPGTGSMLLQAVVAVFIGLSIFWRRVLNAVRSFFGKNDKDEP